LKAYAVTSTEAMVRGAGIAGPRPRPACRSRLSAIGSVLCRPGQRRTFFFFVFVFFSLPREQCVRCRHGDPPDRCARAYGTRAMEIPPPEQQNPQGFAGCIEIRDGQVGTGAIIASLASRVMKTRVRRSLDRYRRAGVAGRCLFVAACAEIRRGQSLFVGRTERADR